MSVFPGQKMTGGVGAERYLTLCMQGRELLRTQRCMEPAKKHRESGLSTYIEISSLLRRC